MHQSRRTYSNHWIHRWHVDFNHEKFRRKQRDAILTNSRTKNSIMNDQTRFHFRFEKISIYAFLFISHWKSLEIRIHDKKFKKIEKRNQSKKICFEFHIKFIKFQNSFFEAVQIFENHFRFETHFRKSRQSFWNQMFQTFDHFQRFDRIYLKHRHIEFMNDLYKHRFFFQFLYCVLTWYQSKKKMFHEYYRQKYLKFLKQMQKRVVVRINDVFQISKTNELNVKLNFLFVKFQLKKFLNIFLIRIVAKFVWKFIISFRITYEFFFRIVYYKNNFLQKLKYYFKIKYDIFIINSKRIFSMICFFWWKSSKLFIEFTINEIIIFHDNFIVCIFDEFIVEKNSFNLYIDDNNIDEKIDVATWCSQFQRYEKTSIDSMNCFTIYFDELYEIRLILKIVVENDFERIIRIFVDNQTTLKTINVFANFSKQYVFKNIVILFNNMIERKMKFY